MKQKKHIVRVPSITRVHNLYRFRFTVNEIAELNILGQPATSVSFEKSLTDYKLSKQSTLKPRDRQGRRSRDHLTTCTHLGLLNRKLIGNEYHYFPSSIGALLKNFDFRDECPKNIEENAIFITALFRFKLTNTHYEDLQFARLRYRPIISILQAIKTTPLHLNQLYLFLGRITKDPVLDPKTFYKILAKVGNLQYHGIEGIQKFNNDFSLTPADIAEVNRSIRPLVTWAQQVGIIWIDDELYCHPTTKGNLLVDGLRNIKPVWFQDLGSDPVRKAVLLFLLQACQRKKKKLNLSFLESSISFQQGTLTTPTNKTLLSDIQKRIHILTKNLNELSCEIDFDLFYDVPYKYHQDVLMAFETAASNLGITTQLDSSTTWLLGSVKQLLINAPEEKELRNLSVLFGFEAPRKELFRVDFEYQSCLILRKLRFNANKYQGNLSELVSESLKNFAENNPDILISNDFAFLVECKSKAEWKPEESFNKRILEEISVYQQYAEEVAANSVIILVESDFVKESFHNALIDQLKKLNRVVWVNHSYLVQSISDARLLDTLKKVAREPISYDASQRLLMGKNAGISRNLLFP
jgi:hypothetical protein